MGIFLCLREKIRFLSVEIRLDHSSVVVSFVYIAASFVFIYQINRFKPQICLPPMFSMEFYLVSVMNYIIVDFEVDRSFFGVVTLFST